MVIILLFGSRSFILCTAHFGYDLPLVSDDEFLQFAIEPAEVGFTFLWPSGRRFDRRQHLIKRFNHHGRQGRVGLTFRLMDRGNAAENLFQSIAKRRIIENPNRNGRRLRRV